MFPLIPVVPALGVLIFKDPLDDMVPTPVETDMNPPVPPDAKPPFTTK